MGLFKNHSIVRHNCIYLIALKNEVERQGTLPPPFLNDLVIIITLRNLKPFLQSGHFTLV